MSFIEPMEADELRKKLTGDLSQLGKIYKSKKSDFYMWSVDHNLFEGLINEGW
jgi:DNA sulfur modification protein DndB